MIPPRRPPLDPEQQKLMADCRTWTLDLAPKVAERVIDELDSGKKANLAFVSKALDWLSSYGFGRPVERLEVQKADVEGDASLAALLKNAQQRGLSLYRMTDDQRPSLARIVLPGPRTPKKKRAADTEAPGSPVVSNSPSSSAPETARAPGAPSEEPYVVRRFKEQPLMTGDWCAHCRCLRSRCGHLPEVQMGKHRAPGERLREPRPGRTGVGFGSASPSL